MKRPLAIVLGFVVAIGGLLYARNYFDTVPGRTLPDPPPGAGPLVDAPAGAVLLVGLGSHHFPVTSQHAAVQGWFDQGLMLAYGFNHDAAGRSFLRATELDPDCAMCWWGAALVLGPHVNAGMDPNDNAAAWERLQKALALAPGASAREQAFIQALAARYSQAAPEDRSALDRAYAEATRALTKQFPDDLDAATFHAEALMDLQPWAYYDADLKPIGGTAEIVATLESVLARHPDHPGALHLYVHAVEASAAPQRAVEAADRLRGLVPGSGHLVHMPAHIYSRVGRWHDAVVVNQEAIEADIATLAACGGRAKGVYPLGYVPHNHHFLWFAASMEGSSALAASAALETAEKTHLPELMRQPGFAGLQHFWMTPWFYRVRFGQWEQIVGTDNPAPDLPYVTAIWRYAQGMAAVRQKRVDDAALHLQALSGIAADPALSKLMVWDRYPLSLVVQIAERTLDGELAAARGDLPAAIAALRDAGKIEDGIPYDEPPGWHAPTRQTLGALLLEAGQAADAEAVYREELKRNPGNGWSLFGLAQSLKAQGQTAEAKAVERELATAWANADIKLLGSRL